MRWRRHWWMRSSSWRSRMGSNARELRTLCRIWWRRMMHCRRNWSRWDCNWRIWTSTTFNWRPSVMPRSWIIHGTTKAFRRSCLRVAMSRRSQSRKKTLMTSWVDLKRYPVTKPWSWSSHLRRVRVYNWEVVYLNQEWIKTSPTKPRVFTYYNTTHFQVHVNHQAAPRWKREPQETTTIILLSVTPTSLTWTNWETRLHDSRSEEWEWVHEVSLTVVGGSVKRHAAARAEIRCDGIHITTTPKVRQLKQEKQRLETEYGQTDFSHQKR